MRAFLFPGQGSQAVGMGAALSDASRAARDVLTGSHGDAQQRPFYFWLNSRGPTRLYRRHEFSALLDRLCRQRNYFDRHGGRRPAWRSTARSRRRRITTASREEKG